MQIIGITGRSGCGKSTLTDSIRAAGFRCVDADQVAREVLLPGSPCIVQLQQEFGADIVDEAGGIATIATILATNHISIKNIGIIHNREFEEGVLLIEFYDQDSSVQAAALLKKYHYIVYEV